MKTIILIAAILSLSIYVQAQNRIIMNNEETIKDAEFYSLKGELLIYLKEGSLHDLPADSVKYIVKNNEYYILEENGQLVSLEKLFLSGGENNSLTTTVKKSENLNVNKLSLQKTQTIPEVCSHPFIAYISPFSVFETDPNIKLSGEVRLADNFSFLQSAGICINNPLSFGRLYSNSDIKEGWVLNSFFKLYLSDYQQREGRNYLALEVFCKNVNYTDKSSVYMSDTSYYYYATEVPLNKTVYGSSIVFGHQISSNKFEADVYFGLGIRHIEVKGNTISSVYTEDMQTIMTSESYTDSKQMPYIRAGIRIGTNFGMR